MNNAEIMARARFEHQLIRSGCADVSGMWEELPEKNMKIPMIEEQEAAISALNAAGYVIVPREPTEKMWTAGREPILCAETIGGGFGVRMHCMAAFEEMPKWAAGFGNMTHMSKGDLAVAVYKAMLEGEEE